MAGGQRAQGLLRRAPRVMGAGSGGVSSFPSHGETEEPARTMPAKAHLSFLQLRCVSPRVMQGARCDDKMETWKAGRARGVQNLSLDVSAWGNVAPNPTFWGGFKQKAKSQGWGFAPEGILQALIFHAVTPRTLQRR